LLSQRLYAVQKDFDGRRVRQWLTDLDDRGFAAREAASAGLAKIGAALEPALRRELQSATTAEKRQRLARLLDACGRERSPEVLRLSRAVSALAEIGTPAAKKSLQELARGDEVSPVTSDARAALKRIE